MNALRQMAARRATKKHHIVQAEWAFQRACTLLELNECIVAGDDVEQLQQSFEAIGAKWAAQTLGEKITFANDSMTVQVSEMFQHLHDIDSGDMLPALGAMRRREALPPTAAEAPSIGPSSHTNPLMTMQHQMKAVHSEDERVASAAVRDALTHRHGFSTWLGPSQAATEDHPVGVYCKGHVPPGTVLALYPGAVFNSEMRQKAVDCGHLANPDVKRQIIQRYDDTVIDVLAAGPEAPNPYAVGHFVRLPPRGVVGNCMRIQFDFMHTDENTLESIPFPEHLHRYVPNQWGTKVSSGQELFGMIEQSIFMKGCVLVSTRGILDEELFVDEDGETGLAMLPQNGATK